MPRLSNNRSPILDELFRAILSLENLDECRTFFSDLFTMQELITFSQRLQVAKLLHVSQGTYSRYESGFLDIPSTALITLAQFYQVSVDYLLGMTDKKHT